MALAQPQIQLAPGGELTSEVYLSSSKPGAVDVLYVIQETAASASPKTLAATRATAA